LYHQLARREGMRRRSGSFYERCEPTLKQYNAHTATAQISICANIILRQCCANGAAFIESYETKLTLAEVYRRNRLPFRSDLQGVSDDCG